MGETAAILIPWLSALAAGVIAVVALWEPLQKYASLITCTAIGSGLVITLVLWSFLGLEPLRVHFYDWIAFGALDDPGRLSIGFSYWLDPLTMIMLVVITGIGLLIATYAAGYMKGDPGYWRFFAYVALFIFSMTTLVMADNLVLLFLGWEGVGVCSYLLIGYYYERPVAVAAAKKAFIVNRIGDFGFLLGIFLCYQAYGTTQLHGPGSILERAALTGSGWATADLWIPYLLMLGAFGKSAQLPLYVWLPDAMAGPTPVSALVHAATMVTAGVYLIARCFPLFELSPYALPTVAVVGGVTALFAATIALTCNDLKGVFAYSTVSQLGYMFLGIGVMSTSGAMFHLFTHAFFKALLFLTAGSVMHALAGQLDIRTMGGLRHKMPVTCWLMFIGCLSLAGFPYITAGFWSKDLILGDALAAGLEHQPLILMAVILGIITAFLTAFYTFRLWFTVFMGPERFTMGDEHSHGSDHAAHTGPGDVESHEVADHAAHHAHAADNSGGPHEMPWLPMNLPLVVLAAGALVLGWLPYQFDWFKDITAASTAHSYHTLHLEHHRQILGLEVHTFMIVLSSILSVAGILLAGWLFWLQRPVKDRLLALPGVASVVRVLENKYYVDEAYDYLFVQPLRRLGGLLYVVDAMVINGAVYLIALLPALVGRGVRPAQTGRIQGYGLGMVTGVALFAVLVVLAVSR